MISVQLERLFWSSSNPEAKQSLSSFGTWIESGKTGLGLFKMESRSVILGMNWPLKTSMASIQKLKRSVALLLPWVTAALSM